MERSVTMVVLLALGSRPSTLGLPRVLSPKAEMLREFCEKPLGPRIEHGGNTNVEDKGAGREAWFVTGNLSVFHRSALSVLLLTREVDSHQSMEQGLEFLLHLPVGQSL